MSKVNDESKEFCSTKEAARDLGVAVRTVQLWVECGALTAWKTAGGHRRILRSSVQALLQERRDVVDNAARKDVIDLLVVEDDEDLMRLYELNVETWDLPLKLTTANDGFEGLRYIGEIHPDVVITDLNMPGMDGFRMLRALKSWPDMARTLIIAVTALGPADIADRGGLPDGVVVFSKPAPFARLEALVRERAQALARIRPRVTPLPVTSGR